MAKQSGSDNYARIYKVVGKIPRGMIATYGQIADLAGLSGHARQVGYALHAVPDDLDIPWQRVVNAKGEVSPRSDPMMEGVQQSLLEAEGIEFDKNGRISLALCRWQPRLRSVASTDEVPRPRTPRSRTSRSSKKAPSSKRSPSR